MSLFPSKSKSFKNIKCPFLSTCSIGNCIYNHNVPKRPRSEQTRSEQARSEHDSAPVKRTKVEDKSVAITPSSEVVRAKPKAVLAPKMVTNPPGPHQQRQQFVTVIRDKLLEQGLADDLAIERAVAIELDVALRSTKFTYSMGIRSAVREILSGKLQSAESEDTDHEQLLKNELVNLLVPPSELQRRRYVMATPLPTKLASTSTLDCARCSTSFPIFHPQTTTTKCKFHLLKREYDPSKKRRSNLFPCCNQSLEDSNGCESRDFHVFKLEEPSQMQSVLSFRTAPLQTDAGTAGLFACGVDCEMAWTTQGFELIRVTVVDYSSKERVYDRLVWPKGKILDLNTRFSGISDMDAGIVSEKGQLEMPVNIETMYKQLFQLITAKTILVGHGLENDLNVLRLIHNRIVDTAILLPRNKTRTYALKELAWEYLGRTIQSGEHDSMEDALAAIDIIQADIDQRCRKKIVKSFK